jgi:hypothetical protein
MTRISITSPQRGLIGSGPRSGPFGIDEVLPTKVSAWIARKHPETGKKQTLLNFIDWQMGQAERIILDFELHVYEWTLKAVKLRESLDKQDKRDIAQAVFAQDRNGKLVEYINELRTINLDREDDDAEELERNAANLALARTALMEQWLLDEDHALTEKDRPTVAMGSLMTFVEYDVYTTLLRVYDHARSHFIFEICEEPVRRFLNATRIRYEDEEDAERMPWSLYRTTLLERMQNSSVIDGLISYILKPRENGCPIGLWVAERIAERRLLNEDGIELSEDTWLELVLAFITNEEKQTLQVPAREKRPEYDENRGYTVISLQETLARFDPSTFRKFQQSFCRDPVALRVVNIAGLVTLPAKKAPPRAAGKGRGSPFSHGPTESHAIELESHAITRDKPVTPKFDQKASLPGKNGRPDEEVYSKFKANGLRRRIWDAIVAGKCVRCGEGHLRVACTKARACWEDDFEKDNFFLPKQEDKKGTGKKKQVRVQLVGRLNVADHRILYVETSHGRCLVDTCSEITIARVDVLTNVRLVPTVVIGHMGGETTLNRAGDFEFRGISGQPTVCLAAVLGVEHYELPAGIVALLGVSEIRRLNLSLDTIMRNPGCCWTLVIAPLSPSSLPASTVPGRFSAFCARLRRVFFGSTLASSPVTAGSQSEDPRDAIREAAPLLLPSTPEARVVDETLLEDRREQQRHMTRFHEELRQRTAARAVAARVHESSMAGSVKQPKRYESPDMKQYYQSYQVDPRPYTRLPNADVEDIHYSRLRPEVLCCPAGAPSRHLLFLGGL